MAESAELRAARRLLGAAEAELETPGGLATLADAVSYLDDVIASGAPEARTARNLAVTYANRIYSRIGARLARDAQTPEPQLEHFFKLVLAFDPLAESLPSTAADLKVAVVRALIERYYEGHPEEHKRRALAELTKIAGP